MKEMMTFLLRHYPRLAVTLWGSVPSAHLRKLSVLTTSTRSLRALLVSEHTFLVDADQLEYFLTCTEPLGNIAWGITINGLAVVLAKSKDEITVSNLELGEETLRAFAENLKEHGVIASYAVIDDPGIPSTEPASRR